MRNMQPMMGFDDPLAERSYWVTQLVSEGDSPRHATLTRVRDLRPVDELLALLQEKDETARSVATNMLWTIWLAEGGKEVERQLLRGMERILEGDYPAAEAEFTGIIAAHPTFAEAYNKRATARYLHGDYEGSLADCERTLELNSNHFGAWHGLGLCYEALNEFEEAVWAFRKALRLHPFAKENRRRLRACLDRLTAEPGT